MIETYRGQAHPWLCDVMQHLNTRHYMAMFDDASMHFLSFLQGESPRVTVDSQGWADVKVTLELLAEVPLGHLVKIRTGVVRLGTKSITYRSVMTDPSGSVAHAVCETVTVAFDLRERKAVEVSSTARETANSVMFDPSAIAPPGDGE